MLIKEFELIEAEIEKLEASEYVQLAIRADRTAEQRSRYLTWLRTQELRGRQMDACGVTQDYLDGIGGEE